MLFDPPYELKREAHSCGNGVAALSSLGWRLNWAQQGWSQENSPDSSQPLPHRNLSCSPRAAARDAPTERMRSSGSSLQYLPSPMPPPEHQLVRERACQLS